MTAGTKARKFNSMITQFFFVLYFIILILSGLVVVGGRNPIHGILALILSFFTTSALLLMIQAEFMAMTFIVIYVGAIAILFLFVVMMLDMKLALSNLNSLTYSAIGQFVGFMLVIELYLILTGQWSAVVTQTDYQYYYSLIIWLDGMEYSYQAECIGISMYTTFSDVFIISSFILLAAMVGAIVLALGKQSSGRQGDSDGQLEAKSNLRWYK